MNDQTAPRPPIPAPVEDSLCSRDPASSLTFDGLKRELSLWARIRHFPLMATFELTPLCNLRCPMCYVRLDPMAAATQGTGMREERWLEIGRQARDMGLMLVTLTGGEPLLHPDFPAIYRGLCELGLLVSIYSNGCLMDDTMIALFRAYPPHSIKLSLYGASNETYKRMCGVRNGFSRVMRAIECLQKSELPFYCTTTVVRENCHDLPALYELAHTKNFRFFHTIGVTTSARGALSDPLASRLSVREEGWTRARIEQEMTPNPSLLPFARCAGHGISFFVTWHGHMQFCGFAAHPYADVLTDGHVDISAAWARMAEQTAAIQTPPECIDCTHRSFCKRCPGLLAAESGDPSRISESFCRRAADMHALYRTLVPDGDPIPAEIST